MNILFKALSSQAPCSTRHYLVDHIRSLYATTRFVLMAKLGATYENRLQPCKYDNINTIVVCGPSGSGKTTLLDMLISFYKNTFKFSVSHTTRKPREKEENGKAYHFVDIPTFERMIRNDEFVEYAKFSGNYYGTSHQELASVKQSGLIPILDVDIRGVTSLKKLNFHARYIFIKSPSLETLERNLRKRGSETAESIAKRLKHAQEDSKIAEEIKFDLIIVNADLKESFEKLKDFLKEDVDKLHRS